MPTLLERAREKGTPLIEGNTATFVWEGPVAPRLLADFNDWEGGEPQMLIKAAPGVWTHKQTLEPDAYIEYAYVIEGERVPDPFNRRRDITNGMGKRNHYFRMPEAPPPTPLVKAPPEGTPQGEITRHVLDIPHLTATGERKVYLYHPPTDKPVPLLVVFDGWDYLRRARLPIIVDNLIAQGRIPPVAMAMVQHGGKARTVEYACSEATLGLLMEVILPLARSEFNLVSLEEHPGAYGVLGASMGGLISLYVALRVPEVFGRVVSQSGAFGGEGYRAVVFDLIRHGPVRPLRIWMDAGTHEWLCEPNRAMHALLEERGYDVAYHEYHGGHNYTSWQTEVGEGLARVFGAAS